MSKLIVIGGQKLKGEMTVQGSKNAVLPILAATILNGGLNVIKNCPSLKDVEIMLDILKKIGCKVNVDKDVITVDSSGINNTVIPQDLVTEMRSSIFILGPILSRFKKVTITYPGGYVIVLALSLFLDSFCSHFRSPFRKFFHTDFPAFGNSLAASVENRKFCFRCFSACISQLGCNFFRD